MAAMLFPHMRIGFNGKLIEEDEIQVGFIGCGSHSFRNIFPVFQFTPVRLVATCDLSAEKAGVYARTFGADSSYTDYQEMLAREKLDAVFIVTGYDERARPLYPDIAACCLEQGVHVWLEKPAGATEADILRMQVAAARHDRNVMVGYKKMFMPINERLKELMDRDDFGNVSLVSMQYPQQVPTKREFDEYLVQNKPAGSVSGFLDHLCHPVSLLVYLLGMPATLYYERSPAGAGVACFTFPEGQVANLVFPWKPSTNGAMERTLVVSDTGNHLVADNNIRLSYHRGRAGIGEYGTTPSYFAGQDDEQVEGDSSGRSKDGTRYWEPEFSLGQLYNKGLFLLGYYNEVNEFARSILDKRKPAKGTLDDALKITRIFGRFAEGPQKLIHI